VALAQSSTRYLSIPSSGFTPRFSEGAGGDAGYSGNASGTARFFEGSVLMFAPVNLPDGATVTSLRCGGAAPPTDFRIVFTLRRNEPQQANVDMAAVMTTFQGVGFQFVTTGDVVEAVVDNATFNYYMVATIDNQDAGFCSNCTIGFCRVGYLESSVFADGFESG